MENTFDDSNIKPEAIKYEPGLIAPLVAAPILLVLLIMLLIVTRKKKPVTVRNGMENNIDPNADQMNDIEPRDSTKDNTKPEKKFGIRHRKKKN